MNAILAAAAEVQEFLASRGKKFCFIGGLAVLRWGEPRTTRDADLCVMAEFGAEEAIIDLLLGRFSARMPNAAAFALSRRILLLSASNGTPLDISLGGLDFEEEMIRRATPYCYAPEVNLTTCSPEDLIIMKSIAGRANDWKDIEGVLRRQRKNKRLRLDLDYVRRHLRILCVALESNEPLQALDALIEKERRQY